MKITFGSDFRLSDQPCGRSFVPSRLHHSTLHIRRWSTFSVRSCCRTKKEKWSESVRTSSGEAKIKYLVSLQFSCGTLFLQSRGGKTKDCDAEKPKIETATAEKDQKPSSSSLLRSRDGGVLVRSASAGLERPAEVHVFCARFRIHTSPQAPGGSAPSAPPKTRSAQSLNVF